MLMIIQFHFNLLFFQCPELSSSHFTSPQFTFLSIKSFDNLSNKFIQNSCLFSSVFFIHVYLSIVHYRSERSPSSKFTTSFSFLNIFHPFLTINKEKPSTHLMFSSTEFHQNLSFIFINNFHPDLTTFNSL